MPAVARMIADYDALVEAVRERCDEMGMTRSELDFQAQLADGHSGKILGRRHVKVFGMKSLGNTLGAIGCKLILVEDAAQTAKIKARMMPRQLPVKVSAPISNLEHQQAAE